MACGWSGLRTEAKAILMEYIKYEECKKMRLEKVKYMKVDATVNKYPGF